jgi:D-aspartate ligase
MVRRNILGGVIIIEGHVQGLSNARALGQCGIPVFVVDTGDCVARHSRYCKGFFKCPPFASDNFASFLIELAVKRNLEGCLLLPSNDHAVLTLSRNKKRLQNHFKMITPGLEVIEDIYDKSRLLSLAVKVGLPIPGTFYADKADPRHVPLIFPVLTRGRFGLDFYKATGRKVFLAHDIKELREQLVTINTVFPINKTLTQEMIPNDGTNNTISFCAFCVNGEIKAYWMGEKLRQHPWRFGTATFAISVRIPECYSESVPLLKALNYEGVCEVEYLRDPRDGLYKLIEINARTWLWVGLARACGVDFAKMAYEYVNGRPVDYPSDYETGVSWINPFTDAAYATKEMCKGRLSPVKYVRSLRRGKRVSAIFARGDWKPGFAYLANAFSYMRER